MQFRFKRRNWPLDTAINHEWWWQEFKGIYPFQSICLKKVEVTILPSCIEILRSKKWISIVLISWLRTIPLLLLFKWVRKAWADSISPSHMKRISSINLFHTTNSDRLLCGNNFLLPFWHENVGHAMSKFSSHGNSLNLQVVSPIMPKIVVGHCEIKQF